MNLFKKLTYWKEKLGIAKPYRLLIYGTLCYTISEIGMHTTDIISTILICPIIAIFYLAVWEAKELLFEINLDPEKDESELP